MWNWTFHTSPFWFIMSWQSMNTLQRVLAVSGTVVFIGSATLLAAEIFGSAAFQPVVWMALGVGAGAITLAIGVWGGLSPEHKQEARAFVKDTVKQSFRDSVLALLAEVRQRILRLLFPIGGSQVAGVGSYPSVDNQVALIRGQGRGVLTETELQARRWAAGESAVWEVPGK